jgi:hypothetical protein
LGDSFGRFDRPAISLDIDEDLLKTGERCIFWGNDWTGWNEAQAAPLALSRQIAGVMVMNMPMNRRATSTMAAKVNVTDTMPTVTVDWEETERIYQLYYELYDAILTVEKCGIGT